MDNSIEERILGMIKDSLMGQSFHVDYTFQDLGYDSIDLCGTIMSAEHEYGVNINESQVNLNMKVGDFIKLVENLVEEKTQPTVDIEPNKED